MVTIKSLENGPYVVEAEGSYVVVKDGKEEVIDRKSIALCRCGASENKPFCDGSHKKINFTAAEATITVK
jgi:CDGSH-type Zn-finger protein